MGGVELFNTFKSDMTIFRQYDDISSVVLKVEKTVIYAQDIATK
jgi:hypothetical protein